ncbi:predicted GPI-anchored protein 58 [Miscanthus floridulus]|uniref:predicted GPI-anchored protein 58 n=1 Tax=Miscanthus floridulus TaxID=154761 RepID=UPI00345A51D4
MPGCPASPAAPPPPHPMWPTATACPAAPHPATTATPRAPDPRLPEEEGGGAGHRRSPTPSLASTRWRCPTPATPPTHAHRPARPEEEENLHAIRWPPKKEEDPAPPANPIHAVRRARPHSEQKVGEREEEEKGNMRREEAEKRGGGGAPPQPLDTAPATTLAPSAASDVPPTSREEHIRGDSATPILFVGVAGLPAQHRLVTAPTRHCPASLTPPPP